MVKRRSSRETNVVELTESSMAAIQGAQWIVRETVSRSALIKTFNLRLGRPQKGFPEATYRYRTATIEMKVSHRVSSLASPCRVVLSLTIYQNGGDWFLHPSSNYVKVNDIRASKFQFQDEHNWQAKPLTEDEESLVDFHV